MTAQEILAAASQLSQAERLQVAIRLLESLREPYLVPQETLKPDLSWKDELHPLVQILIGAVPSGNEDFQASYIDYLEKKYG